MAGTTPFQSYLHRYMHIKQEPDLNMAQQEPEHIATLPEYESQVSQQFAPLSTYGDLFTNYSFDQVPPQSIQKTEYSADVTFKTSFSEWLPSFNQSSGSEWLLNSSFTTATSSNNDTLNPQSMLLAPHPMIDNQPVAFTPAASSPYDAASDWSHIELLEENSTSTSPEASTSSSLVQDVGTPESVYTVEDDSDEWAEGSSTVTNTSRKRSHLSRTRSALSTRITSRKNLSVPSIPVQPTQRAVKDDLLLTLRRQGYSYRDIKRIGKFKEADSTLRGRVRTLTKDKKDRVRKPVWHRSDEALLMDAVRRHHAYGIFGRSKHSDKIPWKKISEWMHEHGGSYLFASATCAKRYEQMQGST